MDPGPWQVLRKNPEIGPQEGLLRDTDARRVWLRAQYLCYLFDWRDYHSCGFGGMGLGCL